MFGIGAVKNTPTVFQMEATECGAASLGMILGYYGFYEPIEKLRVACGVSRNGSKASLILKAASHYYNMETHGYRASIKKLDTMPTPSILFWEANHYVVYEGRRGNNYYINDPARGKCRYKKDDFEKAYSNVVLTFKPTPDFKKSGRKKGVFETLFPLLFKVKTVSLILLWAGLLLILPGLLLPSMLQLFVDEIMTSKQLWLFPMLIAYALTIVVSATLTKLTQNLLHRGTTQLTVNETVKMLKHLMSLPMEFYAQRYASDLQNRMNMNEQIADGFFELVANNAIKIFTASFFFLLMFRLSSFLSLLALLTALINFALLTAINQYRQVTNQALVTAETKLVNQTMIGISLMETLRASGREQDFYGKWANYLAVQTNKRVSMQRSGILFRLIPNWFFGINSVVILCFGSYMVISGDMTLGGLMAFQSLVGSFTSPIIDLISAGSQIQELKGAQDRIADIMNYKPEKRFAEVSDKKIVKGKLELRNISFGYSHLDEPFIKDFSFVLEPGKRIALVGGSGSGKTTIAKIAAGLYSPWSGEILVDDVPIGEYTQKEFNRGIATVDQSISTFSGTISDNLTLFNKEIHSDIQIKALQDAKMEEDLASRGRPLAIEVIEGGKNFSGGQLQRLEIARAFVKKAPILILDEATSALDPVTEVFIDQSVRNHGCSCLIVAHRLSTIRDADEIIMMKDGCIVERGTHDELMDSNGAYAALMNADNSMEDDDA